MKYKTFACICLSLLLSVAAFAAPPISGPHVLSRYAVLIDADSGKVLWARNADAERSIASTTKIMTAILLLERGHLDDIVTAPNGIDQIPESSLHLSPGEKISLHDMLYAMLLRSANDTAVAGADYLCGSVPAFAAQMNAKAQEIGATRTHFVSPNGLYDPNHYSTAADMAKITRYAVNNLPEFNTIVHTQRYKVQRSMHTGDIWMINTASKFLKTFPGADGVKTGYIRQAGHCFVGSATRRDWRLIAVVLDSNKCREDVMSLLNYGFADYAPELAVAKGTAVGRIAVPTAAAPVPVEVAADVSTAVSKSRPIPVYTTRVTPLPQMPQAPFPAGTELGTLTVLAHGKAQATGAVVAARDVPLNPALALVKTGKAVGMGILRGACWLGGVIMAGFAGILLYARLSARATAKSAGRRRNRIAPDL